MSNTQPRVAMVEPVGGHRGNDIYDFGLCKAVADQGTDITLYTCDETSLDLKHKFQFEVKKFYHHIYGKDPAIIRGARYARGALRTVNHAQKEGKNLMHFHLYHFANREFLNFYLFRRRGFKVVATIHDVEGFEKFGQQINKSKYSKFEKRIDRIIVHSKYALESLQHYFPLFPKDKIHTVPHGDTDFLYKAEGTPADARKKLGLPEDKKIILFFGQIKMVKGVDVLLKAYAEVRKRMPDTKLLVVGDPWKMELDELQSIVREKGIGEDCILNFKYVPNEDVPYYYKAADMVVLPYRKIYSSGVMIRSLDYGLPIIASDLDTFKQIIVSEQNGLLFQNENETDLANKIIFLLQNPSLAGTMVMNAKKTSEEKFSWNVIGREVVNVYKMALNER